MNEMDTPEVPQSASDHPAAATEVRYLVRQPILNAHHQLHGYELLFQLNSAGPAGGRGLHATRTVLDDILLYGLESLTGGQPAFITCSAESLTEPLVSVLPPEHVVLEIPEQLEASPKLLGACRNLKDQGYRLALTDFSWGPMPHMLLPLVDYVKVDFACIDSPGLERLRKAVAGAPVALLGENVNSRQTFQNALAEGCTYFQGFHFCEPDFIQKAKVPSNRLLHTELLAQLRTTPLDLKKVAPLVKRDTALVYRLLKLVNSPICAIRQEVTSIETAILVLGEEAFRRIAMLAALSELNSGQPAEILHTALIRARFCELAAPSRQLDPAEQYMVGLLSLLPVMLQQSMAELASGLPLRADVKRALLGHPLPERSLLAWIEAHEKNEVVQANAIADQFSLNIQRLEQYYVDAVVWESLAGRALR